MHSFNSNMSVKLNLLLFVKFKADGHWASTEEIDS